MALHDAQASRAAEPAIRQVDGKVPGAALAMVRGGEPLFARCYGYADLEWRQPPGPPDPPSPTC